jgi:hypothetical protein
MKDDLLYKQKIVSAFQNKLSVDLKELHQIEAWFLKRHGSYEIAPVTLPKENLLFNSLLVGILNEEKEHAKMASLFEHFFEKTDIRYKHSDIKRRKGARIKVIPTSSRSIFNERISKIKNSDEMIILSPVTLASFILEKQYSKIGKKPHEKINNEIKDIFDNVFEQYIYPDDLAKDIRFYLIDAIELNNLNSSGNIFPWYFVPYSIRLLVREYTLFYGYKTTQALRVRESKYGQKITTQRKAMRELKRKNLKR